MNELIQKFSDQAASTIYSGRGNDYVPHPYFVKEFARLIVQECIDTIEQNLYNSGDEWDRAIRFVSNDVKEHFGVEE